MTSRLGSKEKSVAMYFAGLPNSKFLVLQDDEAGRGVESRCERAWGDGLRRGFRPLLWFWCFVQTRMGEGNTYIFISSFCSALIRLVIRNVLLTSHVSPVRLELMRSCLDCHWSDGLLYKYSMMRVAFGITWFTRSCSLALYKTRMGKGYAHISKRVILVNASNASVLLKPSKIP